MYHTKGTKPEIAVVSWELAVWPTIDLLKSGYNLGQWEPCVHFIDRNKVWFYLRVFDKSVKEGHNSAGWTNILLQFIAFPGSDLMTLTSCSVKIPGLGNNPYRDFFHSTCENIFPGHLSVLLPFLTKLNTPIASKRFTQVAAEFARRHSCGHSLPWALREHIVTPSTDKLLWAHVCTRVLLVFSSDYEQNMCSL
jgi:hypothetical protein